MRKKYLLFIVTIIWSFSILGQGSQCDNQKLGKIEFKKASSIFKKSSRIKLDRLVDKMNKNSACEILAISYYKDFCDKCGALSWDRVKSLFEYLNKKGINKDRFRSYSNLEGNADFISLEFTSMPLGDQLHPSLKDSTQKR